MTIRRIDNGQIDDGHSDTLLESEAALEELLGKAEPRPAPPREVEADIRSAVHAEWNQQTRSRVQRRRFLAVGLAASLLVATFASLSVLRGPGGDAYSEPVASIDKQFGMIRVTGADSEVESGEGPATISSGQTLETGDESGIALAWSRGGSLRIDQSSRVRFESRTRIRLLEGTIYYDTVSDALSTVTPLAGSVRLLVETPHGTLRHLGTQFAAELSDDGLRVFVREGAVRVESDDIHETAAAGQSMQVSADRAVEFASINGSDDYWQWVQRLSPAVKLDGRTVHEALTWISRESGMEVRFTSRAAEQNAKLSRIKGMDDVGSTEPSKALDKILLIQGFDWRVESGVIIVSEHDDGDGTI